MYPDGLTTKLTTYIISICIFLLGPPLIILSTPFLLLRYIIGKLGPYFEPDLDKLVTTRSTYFASEDIYNNPKNNVLFIKVLEGNLDTTLAKEIIKKKVIEAVYPTTGKLVYPELQQYITTWYGYYFWKADKSFNLNKQIKLYQGQKSNQEKFTDTDWIKLREKLLEQKWDRKKPLWEIIFIRNYFPSDANDKSKPHTLFIWRFHHGLCGGYCLQNLILRFLDNTEDFKTPLPERVKRPLIEQLLFFLTAPFGMSLIAAEFILIPFVKYPWRVHPGKKKNDKTIFDFADKIPISRIKEIKNHFNVSFSSVLFAALAGAHREMIIKKNYPLPNVLPTLSFLPISLKSIKLDNFMTCVFVHLPVGESDPIKRLKFCNDNYQSLKKSHAPLLFKYMFPLLMSFFDPITKILSYSQAVSGLSNFSAGLAPLYFTGLKCVDAMFASQTFKGSVGTGATLMSYADDIRICQIASSEVLAKEDVTEMVLSIQRHIDLLYKHVKRSA